jgi:protein-tyrosine phosphatase
VIDLHCHILPALDDGARDLADSVAMARQAERDGIEIVCATPHIRSDHDVRIEELPARIGELRRELERLGVRVRIAQGAEVAEPSADALSDEHLRELSLGGGGWILLEPAAGPLADELLAVAERLHARGARTIVAHPERHAGADFEERLRALAERGCLIQWTAEFIEQAEPAGPGDLVLHLARAGLVHVLASDAHSSHGGRTVTLGRAYARLAEACPAEQVRWIAEGAPAAILAGDPLPPRW